ncbi:MAG: hypothetical protein JW722_06110 [Demequinaceae bacterium]|nr:hypothetical protein [Demequinaceae bacterium]
MSSTSAARRTLLGRVTPGLALFLTAPIVGELVSGHLPPAEFFNPLTFLLNAAPYGLGALACRELIVRWGKGWWSLMFLGLAYGLYEEGVVARSLFDAKWSEMGSLADYNHVAGVNWTYTEVLLHFHTTVSILASVALVQILFPTRRRESWISTRKFAWCGVGLLAWTPALISVQILVDDPEFQVYFPPIGLFLLVLVGIVGCVLLARALPDPKPPTRARPVPHPLAFGVLGAVNMLIVFVAVFAVPEWNSPPPLAATFLFVLVFDVATIWLVSRWSGNLVAWDDRHIFALVAGHLSFFIVFAVLADLDDGFTGKTLVAIGTAYLLWRLWRLVASRSRAAALANTEPCGYIDD